MRDAVRAHWVMGLRGGNPAQSGVHAGSLCKRAYWGSLGSAYAGLGAACRFLGREPALWASPSRDGPQHHHRGTHALTPSQA